MINFVLISNKRTGSTFLQEAIDSHPQIKCCDEMFLIRAKNVTERKGIKIYRYFYAKDNKHTPKKYLEWISHFHNNTGLRIVYPQLDYWKELSDCIVLDEIPVLHLIRYNYFEQSMSWFTKKIPNQKEKIYIDPNQLIDRINKISKDTEYYRNLYKNNKKYMEIYYEDMFGNVKGKKVKIKSRGAFNIESKQTTYLTEKYSNQICDFLNVEHNTMFSNVSKRTDWDVWKYIQNQEEIKEVLIYNNLEGFIRKW